MRTSKLCTIMNSTQVTIICTTAYKADTVRMRLCGLLGKKALAKESGLLITRSSGVHTFGMRFPIDIVALDRNLRVLGVWENVGPSKIRGLSFRTHAVLELQSGRVRECNIAIGDQLLVTPLTLSQVA